VDPSALSKAIAVDPPADAPPLWKNSCRVTLEEGRRNSPDEVSNHPSIGSSVATASDMVQNSNGEVSESIAHREVSDGTISKEAKVDVSTVPSTPKEIALMKGNSRRRTDILLETKRAIRELFSVTTGDRKKPAELQLDQKFCKQYLSSNSTIAQRAHVRDYLLHALQLFTYPGGCGTEYGRPSETNSSVCTFVSPLSFSFLRNPSTPNVAMCGTSPTKQWPTRSTSDENRFSRKISPMMRQRRSADKLFDAYSSVGIDGGYGSSIWSSGSRRVSTQSGISAVSYDTSATHITESGLTRGEMQHTLGVVVDAFITMYDETFLPLVQKIKAGEESTFDDDTNHVFAMGGVMVVEFLSLLANEIKKRHPFLVDDHIAISLESICFDRLNYLPFNVAAYRFRQQTTELMARLPRLVQTNTEAFGLPPELAKTLQEAFGIDRRRPTSITSSPHSRRGRRRGSSVSSKDDDFEAGAFRHAEKRTPERRRSSSRNDTEENAFFRSIQNMCDAQVPSLKRKYLQGACKQLCRILKSEQKQSETQTLGEEANVPATSNGHPPVKTRRTHRQDSSVLNADILLPAFAYGVVHFLASRYVEGLCNTPVEGGSTVILEFNLFAECEMMDTYSFSHARDHRSGEEEYCLATFQACLHFLLEMPLGDV